MNSKTDNAVEPVNGAREKYEAMLGFARRAVRFWPSLLVTIVLGAAACAAFLLVRKPDYRSQTLLLYTGAIQTSATDPAAMPQRDSAVRLREMLLSRPRLQTLMEQHNLYPEIVEKDGCADAIEEFRKDVDFHAPGGDTFTIGFKGKSPEQ